MPHDAQIPTQPAGVHRHQVDVRHGNPDLDHVSTSYVERAKPYDAHGMRRFTRSPTDFEEKSKNHEHAIALHFMHYNFCRSMSR